MEFEETPGGLLVPAEKAAAHKPHPQMDLESHGTPEFSPKNSSEVYNFPPTSKDCEADKLLFESDHERAYATWHPQWGGYVGRCVVLIGKDDIGGCFQVINWHDGEFPSDETYQNYHYCCALQLLRFGLEITEKQVEASTHKRDDFNPSEGLRDLASKMIAMADRIDNMPTKSVPNINAP